MRYEEEALELLQAYQVEVEKLLNARDYNKTPEATLSLVEADPRIQIAIIAQLLRKCAQIKRGSLYTATISLLDMLLVFRLPYEVDDICILLSIVADTTHPSLMPIEHFLHSIVYHLANPEVLEICRPQLEYIRKSLTARESNGGRSMFLKFFDDILTGQEEHRTPMRPDDEWGTSLIAVVETMEEPTRIAWVALLRHCTTAKSSTPPLVWQAQARRLSEELGAETFRRLTLQWISAFGGKKGWPLDEENRELLRELIWCCVGIEDTQFSTALADAAIEGYRKVSGIGPRSPKIGDACVYALKSMPGVHGIGQLERVRLNVKQDTYSKNVERALDELATREGMTRIDLEELTVPTFELSNGQMRQILGTVEAHNRDQLAPTFELLRGSQPQFLSPQRLFVKAIAMLWSKPTRIS